MDIAVIIPCHNFGHFLADAIESVLAQTHKPAEIVVILDGCTDSSADVAAQYRGHGVRSIVTHGRDIYLSRRTGLRHTKSPFAVFLDPDDVLTPDYLASLVPHMTDGVGIVTGWLQEFGFNDGEWRPDPSTTDIEQQNCVCSASLFRREAIEQARAMEDLSLIGIGGQDWHTWKKVHRAGWKIAKADGHYLYRRHETNATLQNPGTWADRYRAAVPASEPARKPRVLFLTPCQNSGGVTRHLEQLLKYGTQFEWVATVIDDHGSSDNEAVTLAQQYMPVYGSEKRHPHFNSELVTRFPTAAAALEFLAPSVDLVYSWGPLAKLAARVSAPQVFAVHCTGKWGNESTRTCSPYAQRILCVCDLLRQYVPDEHRHRARVVLNGTDFARLAPNRTREDMRQQWGIPDGAKTIGLMARWSPEKNPMALAQAVNALGPDYYSIYCGPQMKNDAERVPEKERREAEQLCDGRIVWTYTPDVGDVYHALDCLLIPSHEEGAPLVAGEALASGCPIVTTPTGYMPELDRACPDIALFVPKSPTGEQLASAVRVALSEDYQRRIPDFRTWTLENLSAKHMVSQWENVFLDALSN